MNDSGSRRFEIYGSFLSDHVEFAIDAHELQEVVRYDKHMASVPLSPSYFLGIFSLRNAIIPVVNMRALLNQCETEAHKDNCIAIVFVQGVRLGLLFDSTSEVLRVAGEQLDLFDYSGTGACSPISGTITLDEGDRLIQLLDAKALTQLEQIPLQRDKTATVSSAQQRRVRSKCITFYTRDIRFGFRIDAISEIISVPEIEVTGIKSKTCLGEMVLRGTVLPVVDFAMLCSGSRSDVADQLSKRIIIAMIGDQPVGFMVDRVDSIIEYSIDMLQRLPNFGPNCSIVCLGCITLEEQEDISMIDHEVLFALPEVTSPATVIAEGNAFDRQRKESSEAGHVAQTLLVVEVDFKFALPVQSINEIIEMPAEIIPLSGGPAYVVGMFNLRRILVSIIDLRVLYALKPASENTQPKLLVVKHQGHHLALLVDAVQDIFSTKPGSVHKTPGGILKGSSAAFQEDALNAVMHEGEVIIGFNMDALLNRVLPCLESIDQAA